MGSWKTVKLTDVAKIQTGISKSAQRKLKNPIKLPYLRVANVQDGFLDLDEVKTISIEQEKYERYSLEYGDILLTEGGDFDKLGRGTIWREEIKNCVHQNHVFVVRTEKKNLIPDYLSLLTSSDYGKRYFIKCSKQSTNLASINSSQLKAFPVLFPDIKTQEEIIERASLWDTGIEKTEALIHAKEHQFGWLQKSVLDDDFKSYGGHLSDYAGIMKQQKIEEVGYLKPLTVKLHCKGIEANERDVQITLSKKGRPYFQRFSGEFLIGRQSFHNGGFGIVPKQLDGFIASSAITTLEIDPAKLDPKYLFYFFSRKDYYLRIGHIMDGTVQKELSDKQIMKLPVSIPSIDKQKEVVALLDTAQQEITLLKKLADQYRTQKRGLMQKLLSGEWHIKNKEGA